MSDRTALFSLQIVVFLIRVFKKALATELSKFLNPSRKVSGPSLYLFVLSFEGKKQVRNFFDFICGFVYFLCVLVFVVERIFHVYMAPKHGPLSAKFCATHPSRWALVSLSFAPFGPNPYPNPDLIGRMRG